MNDNQCVFSIVIPVYNGADVITKCLDSIYLQGLSANDFEVVCVNDCSTDNTVEVIEEYKLRRKYSNLNIVNHSINKRSGGARNTGIKRASGAYILFIDCDDCLQDKCLPLLKEALFSYWGIDMMMYDMAEESKGGIVKSCCYPNNLSKKNGVGKLYIQNQEISWSPCCYLYRRKYLLEQSLFFEENVYFEDTDYVIKCIVNSQSIIFVPIVVFCYITTNSTITKINGDSKKIIDYFKQSERIKQLAIKELQIDKKCARAIINHHLFHYKSGIKRYLSKLSLKQTMNILKCYTVYIPNNSLILTFAARFPFLFSVVFQMLKIFIPLLKRLYRLVNK